MPKLSFIGKYIPENGYFNLLETELIRYEVKQLRKLDKANCKTIYYLLWFCSYYAKWKQR